MKTLLFVEIRQINGAGSCTCRVDIISPITEGSLVIVKPNVNVSEATCKEYCCERDIAKGQAKLYDYRGYSFVGDACEYIQYNPHNSFIKQCNN